MDLYKRYVDDQFDVCAPINPGWRYNIENLMMEFDETLAREVRDEPAIRTAKLLQSIANSIKCCTQVKYDTPDSNCNNMMPVLDLEVWCANKKVKHRFYKKSVSSDYRIMERSPLSDSTKSNVGHSIPQKVEGG